MKRLVVLTALLAGLTSGTPTSLHGSTTVLPTQLTIYGSVTRQSHPVTSATIKFFASPYKCGGHQQIVGSAPLNPASTETGSYRAQLLLVEPSDSLCVRITAYDASRGSIDSVTVVRQPVAARSSSPSMPVDSLRIDLSFGQP